MLVTQAPQKHLPESSAKAASSGSETESTQLSHPDRFSRRHIGPTAEQITQMLEILRFSDLTAFTEAVVPPRIRLKEPLHLPAARSEYDLLAALKQIASQNQSFRSFIGMGYYDCITPAVIERNILENPSWYTPYTPYQAEIAQGRLEALLNFQSLVIDLTGLEVANASLLDEATAAAEAMIMCHGAKPDGRKFLVSAACHPQVIAVVKTRARALGLEVLVEEHEKFEFDDAVFGALVAYPNTYGEIHDYSAIAAKAHGAGALLVVDADLLSLCLLRPPGEFDADIAIGSAQRFGVPLGYGGPHAAYCATRDALKRRMPGRIVGVSKDSRGRPALRLALQTREQHIRREKATSNICTAQALLATMASMYACYHGPVGLKKIAQRIDLLTHLLADGLQRLGHKIGRRSTPNSRPATPIAFFDTIYVDLGSDDAEDILKRAQVRRMNFRQISEHAIGISLDETTALSDVVEILETFNGDRPLGFKVSDVLDTVELAPAHGLLRTTPFLQHSIFNRFHSETEMLRYMKRLESLDLSLTNSMIPLGSCTMKLNAAAEMIPVTWSEFGRIHPFAPSAQVRGYQTLFRQLEDWLAEITGFASVSLQPNAGSQGEYAGLLVISAYHASRGESRRKICLIPSSAHGTNPASAVMAGLKVVSIGCDTEGNIDLADLRAKATQYKNELAALMVTYPSTHGVFEEAIKEICQIIHAAGGLVYMDGANMNAQVGLCRPGEIGADVCHLNLHKTFCIPHGGGGPGMGPIAVAEHLRAFLPDHPVVKLEASTSVGAVSAAPWGSASILIIPWIYIAAMGAEGLTEASQVAILNANYIVRRVEKHFPVLYRGRSGLVAHECILDVRQFRKVTVEDIAKRLMDYGFHAPTISWPVPGTMMIEPTESESKEELDRFCDALLSIHEEIMAIENGKADAQDNVLKNSPHTADSLASDTWRHPYSREQAAYPTKWLHEHKFWPAVGRIDNVYGDRNLVCSCAGMEDY